MSVAEQRHKAVMAVITEGRTISQVARDLGVRRQTMHAWLARYEAKRLDFRFLRSGDVENLANLCFQRHVALSTRSLQPRTRHRRHRNQMGLPRPSETGRHHR